MLWGPNDVPGEESAGPNAPPIGTENRTYRYVTSLPACEPGAARARPYRGERAGRRLDRLAQRERASSAVHLPSESLSMAYAAPSHGACQAIRYHALGEGLLQLRDMTVFTVHIN